MSVCEIKTTGQEGTALLLFAAETGLQQISDLKQRFMETLRIYKAVALDASQVVEFSFAVLQLCYSLWKTAERDGKEVFFVGEIPPVIQNLMHESGLDKVRWIQHRDLNH